MSKATVAKILGWGAAFLTYAQQAIAQQSVLPHDARGYVILAASIIGGFALHHASGTDGTF